MFAALGRFDYRYRRWLPGVAVLVLIASFALAAQFGGQLSGGGWTIPGSESVRGTEMLADRFGGGVSSMLVVYRDPDGDAASPAFQERVNESLARVAQDEHVRSVITFGSVGDASLISEAGDATYAVVQLDQERDEAIDDAGRLAALVDRPEGVETYISGVPLLNHEFNVAVEEDLLRAELISLPAALIILLFVFGTVVGAAIPLLVAALALPTAFALIALIAGQMEMSIFVTNVVTMIGLALAIDYSLFMVSRFREELRHTGGDVALALERTMASVGKAVAVSGVAVAIGLSALIVFSAPALRSMGVGGVVVVLATLFFAMTALPAILGMLGPRVNRLRLPVPRWIRDEERTAQHGAWSRIASTVMRFPLRIGVPALVLLLAAGIPFLHLELSTGDSLEDLPPSEARTGFEIVRDEFTTGDAAPVVVALQLPGAELTEDRAEALRSYVDGLEAVDGTTAVHSVLRAPPGIDPSQYAVMLAAPAGDRPHELTGYIGQWASGDWVRLEVFSAVSPDSDAGRSLVERVRAVPSPEGTERLVSGPAAFSTDFMGAFEDALPVAAAIVIGVTLVVLFLTFGSILLPIKAVLMTLLSISASFGALVWIFQDGNLSEVLGFETGGTVIASTPIIMFAVVFGLSMDYEVLLLSRIRERFIATGDNRRAVSEGLGATGGIITGAALIMIAVFGAFALGDVVVIKALGFGMALAVLIDATIVRGILVPAFMRVAGGLNWWAPAWLQRVAARTGLYDGPPGRWADDTTPAPDRAPAAG